MSTYGYSTCVAGSSSSFMSTFRRCFEAVSKQPQSEAPWVIGILVSSLDE